ncbi:uroporphyrinogen-III synthase [Halocatena marina]|uniref:uroporphyrinogen-III synthase n=1 Tax=Halocatena marina TaxID=2934937 RepID=UPI00361D6228
MTAIAVFRPNDDRMTHAVSLLEELGVEPIADPMLAVEPTGAVPREDADYTILTSKTGVELAAESGWSGSGTICAIGDSTAGSLDDHGYAADIVPDEFSSRGLVASLADRVDGTRIEVARSDHGSSLLTDGLANAGAYVHETVLYRLVRPPEAGVSSERIDAIDGALFTSSLTVEHFLDAAQERDSREAAIEGLNNAIVGAIGEPTQKTAEAAGIAVDAIPKRADFETLARTVVDDIEAQEKRQTRYDATPR